MVRTYKASPTRNSVSTTTFQTSLATANMSDEYTTNNQKGDFPGSLVDNSEHRASFCDGARETLTANLSQAWRRNI